MPFPVGHALIGATLFNATQEQTSLSKHRTIMLVCAALAMIPDADFVFDWGFNLRGWHRGFTHSFAFGLMLGGGGVLLTGTKTLRGIVGILLAALSHAPLDALLTSPKGTGVELLWPFSDLRFKWGTIDYFYFPLDPRFDPWRDIFFRLLKVSLFELVVFGFMFWLVLFLKKRQGSLLLK